MNKLYVHIKRIYVHIITTCTRKRLIVYMNLHFDTEILALCARFLILSPHNINMYKEVQRRITTKTELIVRINQIKNYNRETLKRCHKSKVNLL